MAATVLSVSELTRNIKAELESLFPFIRVKGEISNCKQHTSGHVYLTLKDEEAQIPVIIWKNVRIRFPMELRDGLEVIADGRLEVYPPAGRYQLICTALSETGEGVLQQAFAKLLAKLAKEGYFNPERKKPIPRIPRRIGLITSATGAVIEDMGNVLSRRFPAADLLLFPVQVQGEKAVESVISALDYFNNPSDPAHRPDVLILARGGGSSEDLQAFNEEAVADAIFSSSIPVISAIGHETDLTIADMVADLRAGTPSIAAELAVPDRDELMRHIDSMLGRQFILIENKTAGAKMVVDSLSGSYAFNRPVIRLGQLQDRLLACEKTLTSVMSGSYRQREQLFDAVVQRLGMLDLKKVLKRGFVLVSCRGRYVASSSALSPGSAVELEFHDGKRAAVVNGHNGS
jgi:exodeoxyribonuclease VII large subunit